MTQRSAATKTLARATRWLVAHGPEPSAQAVAELIAEVRDECAIMCDDVVRSSIRSPAERAIARWLGVHMRSGRP